MSKFAEVKIGMGTFRTVSDRGNIPQGLFSGQRFVAKKDLQYVDKTFLKGAGMEFVGYAVVEVPSSDDDNVNESSDNNYNVIPRLIYINVNGYSNRTNNIIVASEPLNITDDDDDVMP